jgi:hypothetical protein
MQNLFSVKKHGLRVFSVLVLLVTLMAVFIPARAQGDGFNVNIPFDFIVAGQTLPAGQYTISTTSMTGVQAIRDRSGRHRMSFMASSTPGRSARQNSGLIFNRYGDVNFLSQSYSKGTSNFVLPKSRREQALAAADHLAQKDAGRSKDAHQLQRVVLPLK